MADLANKYAENVAGKFYVDVQCIDCDLCRETAPANYTRSEDGGYSYVFKQPTTPEEEVLCKEAMDGCPVEAALPPSDSTITAMRLCSGAALSPVRNTSLKRTTGRNSSRTRSVCP